MRASCAPQPGHTQLGDTAENSLCLLLECGDAATSVPQESLDPHPLLVCCLNWIIKLLKAKTAFAMVLSIQEMNIPRSSLSPSTCVTPMS